MLLAQLIGHFTSLRIDVNKVRHFSRKKPHYTRGGCIEFETTINDYYSMVVYDYAFLSLYIQSRHFDNSKMVNWVNLVQKLTKIQGKV